MSSEYAALLFHEGERPSIDTTEVKNDLRVVEEVRASEFLGGIFGGSDPDLETDIDNVDIILVAVSMGNPDRIGRGVEGLFHTSDTPVACITPKPVGTTAPMVIYGDCAKLQSDYFDMYLHPADLQRPRPLQTLMNLIDEYETVNCSLPLTEADVPSLLGAPETADVESVIPGFILDGGCDDSRLLSAWIRDRFLDTPGPVVGIERVATRLGMTVDVFEERREFFESAEYDGVFSEVVDEKWWLKEALHLGYDEFDLYEHEQPICVVCGRGSPDRIAEYIESERTTLQPVHYRCSNIERSRRGAYLKRRTARPETERIDTLMDKL